jgi:hypothetical protein
MHFPNSICYKFILEYNSVLQLTQYFVSCILPLDRMAAVHHKQCATRSKPLGACQKGLHPFTRVEKFCVTKAEEKENGKFWM